MHKVSHCILAVAAPMLCVGMFGCTVADSRRAEERAASIRREDIKVTSEQLRLRMRSLVGQMCGQIQQSADAISAGTDDVKLKLAALNWKIDAVPAMREALFRPDPYTAALDTAALCVQMTNYFETGPGKEQLGTASAQAATDCRRMTDEYFKVIASGTTSGDVSKAREFVEKWAADHPIRRSIPERDSALSRVYEQLFEEHTTAEYVADAAATVDDLTRKMDVYSDQIFRRTRWEVDRMKLELTRDLQENETLKSANQMLKSADQAVGTVNHLAPAIERTLSLAADAPKIITAERETVVKTLRDEMDRAFKEIHNERVAALEDVSKERVLAMKDLHNALSDQATQLTTDADQISTRKIDEVFQRVTRLLIIGAVALAIAALVGLLLVRRMIVQSRG